jgi:hypothetical protein
MSSKMPPRVYAAMFGQQGDRGQFGNKYHQKVMRKVEKLAADRPKPARRALTALP